MRTVIYLQEKYSCAATRIRENQGGFSFKHLIVAYCILVTGQVLALANLGHRTPGPLLSEGAQLALGLICILACTEAFWRSRGVARYAWRLLAVAFIVWAVAQALGVYSDFSGDHSLDSLDDLIFFLSVIPFGMLPFLDPDGEPNHFDKLHILDFVQVCIFWVAIFLCFSPRMWSLTTAFRIGHFTWSRNTSFDGLLATTFVLRALLTSSKAVRSFFGRMAIFLVLSGLADSYALSPGGQDLEPGGWFDLTWSVLLAIPILIAATWKNADRGRTDCQRSQSIVIDQFFPLLYPLFSFFILARVDQAYPLLGPAVFALAIITFAARVLIIQHRQARNEEELLLEVEERKHTAEALLYKTALLEAQTETTIDGILAVDESDHIVLANKQFGLNFGIPDELLSTRDDLIVRKHVTDQVEGPDTFIERVKYLNSHRDERSRDELRFKNGKIFDRYSAPLIDSRGGYRGRIWYFRDITDRKRAEEALRQAEEKYRAIFENAVTGIFQATPELRPLSANRALAQMYGYDSPEQFLAEVSNVAEQLFVDPSRIDEMQHLLVENGVVHGIEVEIYRRDRTKKWVLVNLRTVRDTGGNILLREGTVEDITDRKVAEERVQYLAYYDALTGLPNRTLLQDRLSTALASARRQKDKLALLFLDLDGFKIINDSLGHSLGDLLLQDVAERLKRSAREQDTVARLGGDEFLIVLTHIQDVADAAVAAERIVTAMTAEFVVQGRSLRVSCSLGLSIFPEHGTDGETLIKNADAAMYCAKENGRNNFQFFTADMNAQAVERLTLENSLRLALDNQEFFLVYQPQMDVGTGKIIGLEALLRWQHPELGLVPPDKFIRIAENSGLIMPIGEWVLRTACSQARKWQDEGLLAVPVAVNVSAVQFRQEEFCQVIKRVLLETGLPPQYLELELTESLLLSNADMMFSVLQKLKAMGLTLAIDDFGTGYSSFSYLRQFPVSKLKIDRSFVRDVAVNFDDAAITTAIISMAKTLHLKVIAEGVENEAQMSFLRAHRCDEIQGYYFSKPLAVDKVADKLRCTMSQNA